MHIAEDVLSPSVCLATGAVSLGAVGYSLWRIRDSLADRLVPLTGMTAALVFAGQMVNFPLGVLPVSGHLIGGVLAAMLVGPWAGCVALSLVLIVQRFLFADGGLLPLGANILHMAVIGSIGGYAVQATVRRWGRNSAAATIAGAVLASWLSVMAAAALFCLEFRLSKPSESFDFGGLFALMASLHSLIGLGEAAITGIVTAFVLVQRPDLLAAAERPGPTGRAARTVFAGMVVALAVAAFLAPFASSHPDGLDAAAEKFGFVDESEPRAAVFSDYDAVPLPWDSWQGLSVSVAGIGGSLLVFALAVGLGRLAPRPARVACEAPRE